jgi:membrane protease YdiL (CAAX protease family)
MTAETVGKLERWLHPLGVLALQVLATLAARWWPDSAAATLLRTAAFVYVSVWFGLKIRTGYRRRRPHWTRQSWLHYLRLAVLPVIAIAVVLFLSSFDFSTNTLGAPRSNTRLVWIAIIFALMIFGVVGLIAAVDWMLKGEPSEQFTRSRWFPSRGR